MRGAIVVAVVASLLAGCARPHSAATSTTGPKNPSLTNTQPVRHASARKPLGVYQLELSRTDMGVSGNVQTLSSANGSGLGAQVTELAGLSFMPTAAQVTTNNDGSKTYTMPLRVTNNSGQSISKLHLVPVVVSNSQNGTFFRNAKNIVGEPSNPTGITLATGGGTTAWSSIMTPARLRASDFSLPEGISFVRYSEMAWADLSLFSFPDGASKNLNLAFNIPASNETYRFSVLFGAFDLPTPSNDLVISAVYGGGGNSGAAYARDYVELYNPTQNPISLSGLSLQTLQNGANDWNAMILPEAVVQPDQFYLIELGQDTPASALPTFEADLSGALNLPTTTGKVALVSGTAPLTVATVPPSNATGNLAAGYNTTESQLIDFVGYGTADAYEGKGPAPAPSVSTALVRSEVGCVDSDDNSADFRAIVHTPRSSSLPWGCRVTVGDTRLK